MRLCELLGASVVDGEAVLSMDLGRRRDEQPHPLLKHELTPPVLRSLVRPLGATTTSRRVQDRYYGCPRASFALLFRSFPLPLRVQLTRSSAATQALFRWLSRRYPKVQLTVAEEQPVTVVRDGVEETIVRPSSSLLRPCSVELCC